MIEAVGKREADVVCRSCLISLTRQWSIMSDHQPLDGEFYSKSKAILFAIAIAAAISASPPALSPFLDFAKPRP